ncbi:MFS general substrate transporter [Wolfiporia cocos MD-104 SS10]|uniref:MFS general substrate transporter n=1 Tax=Wolfiporia cocos (strain MD-104) TaxID=742152 RepID=A0A2H3K1T5_WOLCO|nr:MFS general substrate transporter [Wolfiporia cocos MD-104 SS10]
MSLHEKLANAVAAKPKDGKATRANVSVSQVLESAPSLPELHARDSGAPRVYKRRWVGVLAIILLNIVSGTSLVWFGPIANDSTTAFGISLDAVNWLGNAVNLTYLAFGPLVPALYARIGVKRSCQLGGLLLVISAWVRYAGALRGSGKGGYAGLLIGQIIAGTTQPLFQVLVPGYSERWFGLQGRTTATMVMSIANPVGNAIGQLISPLVGTPKESVLVMAIIYTAAAPFVFLVGDAPPTPPTYAAAQKSPSFMSFVRAMVGREPRDHASYMTPRQRSDLAVLTLVFGVLVGVVNAFSILTAQDVEPYGYSDDVAGLLGAVLLLVGIVAAALTAPLFDRVFTHHLALTCKLLCPILGGAWLSLIWAVKRDNTVALFVIMGIIGASSMTMLPVALELAVELTRNADASSAVLWSASNLIGVILVLAQGALRDGPDANPPYNMKRALIFQGAFACATVALLFLVQGEQTRRALDEAEATRREASGLVRDGGESREPGWDLELNGDGLSRSGSIIVNDGEATGIDVRVEDGPAGSVDNEDDARTEIQDAGEEGKKELS